MEAASCYNKPHGDHEYEFPPEFSDCEESLALTPPPCNPLPLPYEPSCYSLSPAEQYLASQHIPPAYLAYENPDQYFHQVPEQIWVGSTDYLPPSISHLPVPTDEGELLYPPLDPVPYYPSMVPSQEDLYGQLPLPEEQGLFDHHHSQQSKHDVPPDSSSLNPSNMIEMENSLTIPVNFNTFPTPCELLTDLTAREAAAQAHTELPESPGGGRVETQRKARQRAVAETIGFTPTDPDTISSHDKKRHYLECLEQYVLYLHEQFRLLGRDPVKLERVSTYRGLSSRSIRTLLVHMQDQLRKHHNETQEEERIFGDLRDKLMTQEAAAATQQFRRHSAS